MTTTQSPTALRDAGMAQAESAADMRVVAMVDRVIQQHIDSGLPFSANDIRRRMPTVESQGLVGARVRAAAMRRPREMVAVGYVPSDLPSTHAHPVRQWRGVAL